MQRDQGRWIAHAYPAFDYRTKRRVPIVSKMDVVVSGSLRSHATNTRHPHQRRRRVGTASSDPRRIDSSEQRPVGDGKIGITHHHISCDPFRAAQLDSGHSPVALPQDAGNGRVVRDCRTGRRHGFRQAGHHRVDSTSRHEHPADGVHVGDHRQQRQCVVRCDSRVHRLKTERPAKSIVLEERGDFGVEAAEATHSNQIKNRSPGLEQSEHRIKVGVE